MSDQVIVDRADLLALVKWAARTPPQSVYEGLEMAACANRVNGALRDPILAASLVMVPRPALAMIHSIVEHHTDNCDIQSAAVHAECKAAVTACRMALWDTGNKAG